MIKNNFLLGLLLGLIILLLFINNGAISLWDQDEAAYAGFGFNCLKNNDWVIPQFMWSDVHRKPPLHFWNIAAFYKLFGVSEFTIRLSSALSILATYLLVMVMGGKLFGRKISTISAIILGSSLLVTTFGKIALTDGTLLFFTTLCAFSMLYVLKFRSFGWALVFWFSFACALLTKGPPIIIFSVIFAGLLIVFHEQKKNLILLHPWFFLPMASLPFVYWGYLTFQEDGGAFITWFVDWYILKRIDGHVFNQTGPPGYHLVMFFLFFVSYFMFIPKAIYSGLAWFKTRKEDVMLLGAWLISGWLFYELSPSKLPAYAVAAHVPLAFLIAKQFDKTEEHEFTETKFKTAIIFHFVVNYLVSITLLLIAVFIAIPNWYIVFICGTIHFIGNTINLYFVIRKKKNELLYSLMLTAVTFLIVTWGLVIPNMDFLKNGSKRVGAYIAENVKSETIGVIANQPGKPPSLPFYINQHLDKIVTEHVYDSLMLYYRSPEPCVLVLSKAQKEWFEWQIDEPRFEKITSKMTDRTNLAEYYILFNKSASIK